MDNVVDNAMIDTTVNTMIDVSGRSWQDWLEHGNASAALQAYVQTGEGSLEVEDTLHALVSMQRALRAKLWQKAQDTLHTPKEDIPTKDTLTVTAIVNWQALRDGIKQLSASHDALEKRDTEAALGALDGLDVPLLAAEVATQRGTAYIFNNQLEDAHAAFEAALEHDPKHYRARTNLGNVALERGQIDDAITHYQAALRVNETFSNALHNLGVAYRRKGEIGKSVQAIRKAQRAMQQEDMSSARQTMKQSVQGSKYRKWFWYVGIGVVVYFILRSRGMI
jgi:tetratricopeptide (TPR) repeat protein